MPIEKLISGDVYSGNHDFFIPMDKRFRIEATKPFKLSAFDEDTGEITRIISADTSLVAGKSCGTMRIEMPSTQFFTIDYQMDVRDPADPVPVELGIPEPLSLRERIQSSIRELLHNEYGNNSKEVETWEEAQDFLMDDTDAVFSPYEILEMVPEEVVEPPPEPVAPATVNPTETTTTAETPPPEPTK